jgi:hypothetical protein
MHQRRPMFHRMEGADVGGGLISAEEIGGPLH